MLKRIKSFAQTFKLMARLEFQLRKSQQYFSTQTDNTDSIDSDSIVLILVVKNEAKRIPFFLSYYRSLGVDHFIVIDNLSDDNLSDHLDNNDISHFKVAQNYNESKYGVHWINYVARKYCRGNWVLSVDCDEFLVYPYADRRDLKCLCIHLDDSGKNRFFTPMVDMYSDKKLSEAVYHENQDPLSIAKYFDGAGYFMQKGGLGDIWIRGGVRMRIFSRENPRKAPAVNKMALMKWDISTYYFSGAHVVLPKRKNKINYQNETSGALLHFKFLSDLYDKAAYAVKHKNHYDDSREYQQYLDELAIMDKSFIAPVSRKYEDFDSLVDAGLAFYGDWL